VRRQSLPGIKGRVEESKHRIAVGIVTGEAHLHDRLARNGAVAVLLTRGADERVAILCLSRLWFE
jgi:hypothetical protein